MDIPTAICCAPLTENLLSMEDAVLLATVLKALADPTRLRLFNIVATAGEACACDLPEALGKSQPTISHHLSQLVKAGILEREQRGKWAWFRVNPSQIDAVRSALC